MHMCSLALFGGFITSNQELSLVTLAIWRYCLSACPVSLRGWDWVRAPVQGFSSMFSLD